MDLLELGALAQMVGAIAIIISLFLVLVELRKNLQQHLLSNTLARSIEVEKMHYQQMDESMANLIVKGRKSYNHCLLYTSPSPRDKRQSRMPSSA